MISALLSSRTGSGFQGCALPPGRLPAAELPQPVPQAEGRCRPGIHGNRAHAERRPPSLLPAGRRRNRHHDAAGPRAGRQVRGRGGPGQPRALAGDEASLRAACPGVARGRGAMRARSFIARLPPWEMGAASAFLR